MSPLLFLTMSSIIVLSLASMMSMSTTIILAASPKPPLATKTLYPSFHVRPPTNWINDPNFLMREPNTGIIHVFCQYNDFEGSTSWGNMSIAHMTSRDYVTWQHLPIAIHRGPEWFDAGGVFSGSVTFVENEEWKNDGAGKMPVIVYTCVDSGMRQRQCVAVPKNVLSKDPLLQEWTKISNNPVIPNPPTGSDFSNFRDPATGFTSKFPSNNPSSSNNNDDESFIYIPFAAKINGNATIVTYRFSPSLSQANFHDIFYQPSKTFEAMVECPDVFLDPSIPPSQNNNPKRILLKDSNMEFRQDFYRIGEYLSTTTMKFAETRPDKIFLDFGMFYASKTFYDPIENMRVLFGWINEDGYDGGAATAPIKTNWAGAQSLPRLVTFNKTFGKLQTPPLPALTKLRGPALQNLGVKAGQKLVPGVVYSVLSPGSTSGIGLAHEITATFKISSTVFQSTQTDDFNVGVQFMMSSSSANSAPPFYTSAVINIPSGEGSADLNNTDFTGSDILDLPIEVPPNATEQDKINFCRELCVSQPSCVAFTYVRKGFPDPVNRPYDYSPRCSMKGKDFSPTAPYPLSPCCVSGRVRKPRIMINRENSKTLGSKSTLVTRSSELKITDGNDDKNTSDNLVTMRIFVDHSFVEVYNSDGLEVASTRVYLEDATQNGIAVTAGPRTNSDDVFYEVVDFNVYPIKSIFSN